MSKGTDIVFASNLNIHLILNFGHLPMFFLFLTLPVVQIEHIKGVCTEQGTGQNYQSQMITLVY